MTQESPRTPGHTVPRAALRAVSLPSALLVLALAAPAAADLVHLKDGTQVKGRVVELGGNSIEVRLRASASRRIYLRDIRKVDFDPAPPPEAAADTVFRKDGSELAGEVKISEDGKTVVVSRPDGSQVGIPHEDVLKIVYRDQARAETAAVYTPSTAAEVREALKSLGGSGKEAQAAEEKLKSYGIFAIALVEEARRTAAPQSPQSKPLERVSLLYRLREVTPDPLQELTDYYRVLSEGSESEKTSLLEEMFTRYVEESVPVAKLLIRNRKESPKVRAWAVDLLGRMELNRDLVDIYNDPQGGQVQLAAAVALARNRILVGAPALIEALELEEPAVRELAIRTLKEAVGKDFGFGVHDTPSARRDAVKQWKDWWTQNHNGIESQAASILSGRFKAGETPERRRAAELWRKGSAAWEAKKLPAAESNLRSAVQADPTFINGQVSLGVFLCMDRGRGEEGRKLLEDLLSRRLSEMGPRDTTWIHYYLAQAWELACDLERSDLEYRRALGIDPQFFRASAALADLKFRKAIGSEGGAAPERRRLLGEAEAQYRSAIGLIETYNAGLETLSMSDMPVETVPPFERTEHNRGVLEVKSSLRKRKAEMHFGIAKIRSLLADRQQAVPELTSAIETLGDEREHGARELLVDLHNYRAFLLEEEGESGEALRDYRSVLKDLDAKNAAALEGVNRLRSKEAPAAPADGARSKRKPAARSQASRRPSE